MNFGEKLTQLRKEKGMSQEELANNLNVSRQAVSKWESNSSYPETDKIIAICKLFNCSMDEIIGLKNGTKKSEKIIDKCNIFFDKIINAIKLFCDMTFKQKMKCFFEMCFYTIILMTLYLIFDELLISITRKILYILPTELLRILIQVIEGIYCLAFIISSVYILVKLYQIRYLNYYEEYLKNKKDKNFNSEEYIKENVKIESVKEEKIIIRDSNSDFKPLTLLKKLWTAFLKLISSCIVFGLILVFVMLIAITIFVVYFINYGLLIFYVALGLLGSIIMLYIMIELLIKFIFNLKQSTKKLFVMFIISIIMLGISSGLFACELTNFKIINEPIYNRKIKEEIIEYKENLVIDFLNYNFTEIIIEDREDILIEFYGTENNLYNVSLFKDDRECEIDSSKIYNYSAYYYDIEFNEVRLSDFIQTGLELIKDKEIVTADSYYEVKPKLYISEEIYNKLIANNNKVLQCYNFR